jgi:hypothetical protein
MSLPLTSFEDSSRVESLGIHEYNVNVHLDFSWGSMANSGYLFSLLLEVVAEYCRAPLERYAQPDTVALHVELLRPAPLGYAIFQVKGFEVG